MPWIKISVAVVSLVLTFFFGMRVGANDVQAKWDKEVAQQTAKAQSVRQGDQNSADAVGAERAKMLAEKDKVISQLTLELSDAKTKLGICGSELLPNDSVRIYERFATSYNGKSISAR